MNKNYTHGFVQGEGHGLVLSLEEKLSNYFKTKRTKLWFINQPLVDIIFAILCVIVVSYGIVATIMLFKRDIDTLPLSFSIIDMVLVYFIYKISAVRIIIKEKDSFIKKYHITIGLVLSGLALLAALYQIVYG